MRPPKILGIIILIFIFHWQLFADEIYQTAQKDAFLNKIFTTKDGLPQNTPTSIIQTKDGYLWIATFGGLARFDGVKFTIFTTSNTPQLINNRITALYEDSNNIIWIGTEDGDIMNYQNGVFSLIKKSVGTPVDNTIVSFYLDQNNTLWIGTVNELRTYNTKTKQFSSFSPETLLKRPINTKDNFHINKFVMDAEGNLWMTSNGGLIRFRDGNFANFRTDDGLPDDNIDSIAVNPNGGVWISTNKIVGLYQDGIFTQIAKIDYEGDFALFSSLAVNNEHHLFFASRKLLYEVSDNIVLAKYDLTNVATDGIRPLFFDNQQNLWVGANNGLIRFTKRRIKVFSSIENKIWIGTSAIAESPDKSVWIASGKNLLRWKNGFFESFPVPSGGIYFTTLAFDKNNILWVGTFNGIYSFENNKFINHDLMKNKETCPIFFDHSGKLWAGERVAGLFEFENGALKGKYTTENGLANNWISYLTEDRSGVIWIGTKGGLSRFENGQFTNFTTENGLENNNVRDIYEDTDGIRWIGTYGGGISRLKDGKIVSITTKNGLAEDIASRILLDDNGIFWILGNQGVYSVSRQSLNDFADGKRQRVYCTVYDENDGMEVGEGSGGNQPAGLKASDGRLWFPMIRGGIIIDSIKPNLISPPIYIEESFLNKERVNPQETLIIHPGQENLEISYTAVSFIKPEQIQFRYKLEDYDSDWQDVGTRRIAYYPYLPPGTYTFKVMATNGNDVWSQNEANLKIVVLAPFWRTWWFLALCILAVILLIVLAYQRRLAAVKQRRLQQEEFSRQLINAHESERNRIAGELHDGLGQNLLVIRNWTLLVLKQLPANSKYRKQLEEITEVAGQSLEETRNITRNLRPQHLRRFGLTETINNMIKQVEDSFRGKFITEIENIDQLFSAEAELSIYRIIQESLNNIVKHSEAKNVKVIISKVAGAIDFTNSQDKLMIKISDDGKGFDLQARQGSSFGLDNLTQRVQLLGGKYSIKSNAGKGTEITIYLNIKEKRNEK